MPITQEQKSKLVKFQPEITYQEKIDQQKQELKEEEVVTIPLLAQRLKELKEEKDNHEAAVKQINLEIEAAQQLLLAIFDEEGMTNFKTKEGFTFFYKGDVYSSVKDKEAFFKWADDPALHTPEAYDELQQSYSIAAQTINRIAKSLFEEGKDLPPSVELYVKESIGMRKPGSKD